jgi:primosomal protein N' (replication factor Y)
MNAALPSALKLASESKIMLNSTAKIDPETLSEKEYRLITALQEQTKLSLSDAARTVDLTKVFPLVHTLIEKGYIVSEEEIGEKFKPRIDTFVKLAEIYLEEKELHTLYDKLERRAPKQLELLIEFVQLSNVLSGKSREVRKQVLMQRIHDASTLTSMVKKGIFILEEKEVSRLNQVTATDDVSAITLTSNQEEALNAIRKEFDTRNVVLLHGVTSSGKTELYIKLIRECLEAGKQALYLLPEIALTTQIINRLQKYFGNEIGVYHSRYDENERVEVWQRVAASCHKDIMKEFIKNEPAGENDNKGMSFKVILGARSAMFLPFSRLGLVIVDEEHDSSFKQYDPAPRYNARDAAVYLATLHGAKVVLGSATPSIESYSNALAGKYGLVSMKERFGGILMPSVEVINLRDEQRKKRMKSIFSETLLENIGLSLTKGEQVILFQNRRGFSLHIDCDNCHWIPQCVQCDVSLVYHKKDNQLRCHYCGYSTRIPEKCPECGYTGLMMKGFGTEKIEEELSIFFPNARIARMDLDSTRSKQALHRIIADFEERRIDILAGTQMVTKGLDFDNVGMVGVLNADNLLSYPDFRSSERGFQLMAQVAGRAGRKNKQGKVLIQAFNPAHPMISFVIDHDYESMYRQQLPEREKFHYPPYYKLIHLTLKHSHQDILNEGASDLTKELRKRFGKRVLGPEFPLVGRIRNLYLKSILIKLEKDVNLHKTKQQILEAIELMHAERAFSQLRVVVDVDPV